MPKSELLFVVILNYSLYTCGALEKLSVLGGNM